MMIHIRWDDEGSYEVEQDGEFIGDFSDDDNATALLDACRFALEVRAAQPAHVDADVIIESVAPRE